MLSLSPMLRPRARPSSNLRRAPSWSPRNEQHRPQPHVRLRRQPVLAGLVEERQRLSPGRQVAASKSPWSVSTRPRPACAKDSAYAAPRPPGRTLRAALRRTVRRPRRRPVRSHAERWPRAPRRLRPTAGRSSSPSAGRLQPPPAFGLRLRRPPEHPQREAQPQRRGPPLAGARGPRVGLAQVRVLAPQPPEPHP